MCTCIHIAYQTMVHFSGTKGPIPEGKDGEGKCQPSVSKIQYNSIRCTWKMWPMEDCNVDPLVFDTSLGRHSQTCM